MDPSLGPSLAHYGRSSVQIQEREKNNIKVKDKHNNLEECHWFYDNLRSHLFIHLSSLTAPLQLIIFKLC